MAKKKPDLKDPDVIVDWSAKLRGSIVNLINETVYECDYVSVNQFLESVFEDWQNPKKINQENIDKIKGLEEEIETLKTQISTEAKNSKDTYNELLEKCNVLTEENTQLNANVRNSKLPENSVVVGFSPLTYLVLDYVAKDLKKRTGKEWTIELVVMYFSEQFFIKGTPNGGLKAPSDNLIRDLQKQLKSKKEE